MQNVRLCLNHNRKANNCGSYGQTLEKKIHTQSHSMSSRAALCVNVRKSNRSM